MTHHAPSIEQALAHSEFVRNLARGLLGFEGARDVEQDTWLAATTSGASDPAKLKGWLGGVVRRRAARTIRQRSMERRNLDRVNVRPNVPSTAEVVAREETRRKVVAALLELKTPYRDALLLRYYEDLPPRRIAERLGVPVETARTRIKRGLVQLRNKLDDQHGGRKEWISLVTPLAGSIASVTSTGLSASAAIGIVALLAVIAVGLWWGLRDDSESTVKSMASSRDPNSAGPTLAATGSGRGQDEKPGAGLLAQGEPTKQRDGSDELENEASVHPERLRVRGRVLDATRAPVNGALVVLSYLAEELARTTTKPDGSYRLSLKHPPKRISRIDVRAVVGRQLANGSLMLRGTYFRDRGIKERKIADLIVKEGHSLSVRVMHNGEPVAGATVYARDSTSRRSTFGGPVVKAIASNAKGETVLPVMSGKLIDVLANGIGFGRVKKQVTLPCAHVVEIELPPNRTVRVSVVEAGSGNPIEGATVYAGGSGMWVWPRSVGCLPPLGKVRTDRLGVVEIQGLPATRLSIVARAPGLAMLNNGMFVNCIELTPQQDEAIVTLHRFRSLKFPIAEPHELRPDQGTELKLIRYQAIRAYYQATPRARIEGDHVVFHGFPPGFDWGHVEASCGVWASWRAPQTGTDATTPLVFRRACDVTVKLVWRDGTPASGQLVSLNLSPRGQRGHVKTDVRGVAKFTKCCAKSVGVYWRFDPLSSGNVLIAQTELDGRSELLEVVLDPPKQIRVRVHVNESQEVPGSFSLTMPALLGTYNHRMHVESIRADRETGCLEFMYPLMRGSQVAQLTMVSHGFPDVQTTLHEGENGSWRADVSFQSTSTLRVHMKRNADVRAWLAIDRWDEEQQRFLSLHDDAAYKAGLDSVDDVYTFRGFKPGRYRLKEYLSGIDYGEFNIRKGNSTKEIEFDVTGAMTLKGRVVVPKGHQPELAKIRVVGRRGGRVSQLNPVAVEPDGSFEFQARRGETLPLIVDHPLLNLHHPHIDIVVGSDEVVLKMAEGPQIHFRLEESSDAKSGVLGARTSFVSVRIAETLDDIMEARPIRVLGEDGVFTCKAPKPGRWAALIQRHGHVPHIVSELEVNEHATDLGVLSLSKGASLTVALQKGAEALPPAITVRATRTSAPAYAAFALGRPSNDSRMVELTGLGEGRFKVVIQAMGKRQVLHTQEFESDGESPINITVQLP